MGIYVIEQDKNGNERTHDLRARMLKDRIVYVTGVFDQEMADGVVAQLLFLESLDADKDIFLYINSPGGDLDAAYSIFDCMNYIKPDVATIAYGRAMSAGSLILAAGTNGKRYALPNANIMIHEFSTGYSGKHSENALKFNHDIIIYERMMKDYSILTGQELDKVKELMKHDAYMSAEEALNFGLIDKVQYKR